MFDLIKSPTDNLYKFAALVGVVIATAFSFYLITGYSDYLKQRRADYNDYAIQQVKVRYLANASSALENKGHERADVFVTIREIESGMPVSEKDHLDLNSFGKPPDLEKLRKHRDELQSEINATRPGFDNSVRDFEMEAAQRYAKRDEYVAAGVWLEQVGSICVLLILCGVGLAVWGFRQWYKRVQSLEDLILKANAREALDKLSATSGVRDSPSLDSAEHPSLARLAGERGEEVSSLAGAAGRVSGAPPSSEGPPLRNASSPEPEHPVQAPSGSRSAA